MENTEGNYHVVRLIDDVLAFAYYGKEKARGPCPRSRAFS